MTLNASVLLDDFESFRNHRVLKNGSALVLHLDTENGDLICKIANSNSAKLEREFVRIQMLRSEYPKLGARIPAPIIQGVIGRGLHRDKTYYLQEYVKGLNLAKYLQNPATVQEEASNTLSIISPLLLDMLEEHKFDPAYDKRSGNWLQQYIVEAYHRLLSLEHIGYLTSLDELVINGRLCKPLKRCLDEIFSLPAFHRLNLEPSSISILSHWNFHSANILIPEPDRPDTFRVVDPDINIEVLDPMFGIARLFYSFPHDTADASKYSIETNVLFPNVDNSNRFTVKLHWPDEVLEKYKLLSHGLEGFGYYNPGCLDNRLRDPITAARLDLCYLYCLIRGVSINHNPEILLLDDNLRSFQNSGVFLFLALTDLANTVVGRFRAMS